MATWFRIPNRAEIFHTGRLTHVAEPFGATLTFAYDEVGNRTSVIDSFGGTEISTYDDANYLVQRTYEGQGKELRVDFDNNKEGWNTTQTRYSCPQPNCGRSCCRIKGVWFLASRRGDC